MKNATSNKVVIITGASSGIGAAVAQRLARDGMRLTLAARRLDRLEQVASEVKAHGGEALVVQTDVCNHAEILRMVQVTLERWGQIDVLINNAGMSHDRPLFRLKSSKIREEINLNLIAVIECTQAVLIEMLRQKSGHIINISSVAGLVATPGGSIYSATKFGVNGFSDSIRRELLRTGIHISIFCPGYTPTELSPALKAIAEGRRDMPHPLWLMPVNHVADQIAHLIHKPSRCVIFPAQWKMLVLIAFLFPRIVDRLIPIIQKVENK